MDMCIYLSPYAVPLNTTVRRQVRLQCSQAPLRAHTITVSISVSLETRLMLVHAVVGHMHTPPPANHRQP